MRHRGAGTPLEPATGFLDERHRAPFLTDRDHLRHPVPHVTRQVLDHLGVAPKVRRVVGEVRVAALYDHPLEVVEVRVQAMLEAEPHRVGGDVRRERRVREHPAGAAHGTAAA